MTQLKDIVNEIERMGKLHRESKRIEAKKTYKQYIELIISEAEKPQQYNLLDYWERLKR